MSQPKAIPSWKRRVTIGLCALLTPVLLTGAALVAFSGHAEASSHREAPAISKDALADNTDTYTFIAPDNPSNVVFVGNWIPFESPEGGPNYSAWDPSALYDIYVDTDGDAQPNVTYTLSSRVDIKNGNTFLYNTGPINQNTDAAWNEVQYYTVTETLKDGTVKTLVANHRAAPVNIGSKSTPDYDTLEKAEITDITGGGKVFAGQTDDPFWVDLQVFDLLTLRGQASPVGYTKGNNIPVDSLAGFNVHSLVIEIPISRIKGSDPVFGVWAGTRRQTTRVLKGVGGGETNSGAQVQVSRLGMPLVNEVVIPLALKDAFNSIPPSADLSVYTAADHTLQKSVEDPEVGQLLCHLYAVPLPGDTDHNCSTNLTLGSPRSGRGDIFDIYLTGMRLSSPFTISTKNGAVELPAGTDVNRPTNPSITTPITGVVPAEMLRINTALSGDICSPTPNRLGILGGDACGFPNGRRLTDDVVDISLLAVAGAAYDALDGRDTTFHFNPALIGVLDDGLDQNDVPFRTTFPYLAQAHSGQERIHDNPILGIWLPFVNKSVSFSFGDVPGGKPMAAGALSLALVALVMPAMVFVRRRKTGRHNLISPEAMVLPQAAPLPHEEQLEDKDK